jgi:16S rRNA (uracil1498-N3)-methyltransferase
MIQKATELGVTKFIPIITDRTIIRKINSNRLEKIIIESSEQSNRLKIPILEKVIPLENFIKNNQKLNIIFGDLNTDNKNINIKKLSDNNPICILIGPEGDFTEEERQKILELKNIQCLKINNNILRAETAAISMISIVNFNFLS